MATTDYKPKESVQTNVFEALESNVQSYARAFPCTFETAKGATIQDENGRSYIDFLAGCGSLNYGHNNPVLKDELVDYILGDGIAHSLDMHTTSKKRFLEALNDFILKPRGLDHVIQFTGPTGTNAVEAAMKIARKATGRTNIVSFTNGFHGVSAGSLAATCNSYHRGGAGIPLFGAVAMPYDGYFGPEVDTVDYFAQMLADPSSGLDKPAAVIVETIQGEGGLRAASAEWLQKLAGLCKANEILLIVDDIQAGCGRAGTFFSFEEAGIVPDIITLAKSLSGFGLPFAAVLLRPEIDIWKPAEHNGTFRGNNHAFITAAATFEHYWQDEKFAEELNTKAQLLQLKLTHLEQKFAPHITEIRGRGLMRGLVFGDPDCAKRVTEIAFTEGLIIERSGPFDEVVKFLMPLTISYAELDAGLEILHNAINKTLRA